MNATGEDAVRLLASMDASLKRLVAIAERRVTDRTQAARAPEVVPDSDLRRAVRQLDHPVRAQDQIRVPWVRPMIRLASGDIPKVVALRDQSRQFGAYDGLIAGTDMGVETDLRDQFLEDVFGFPPSDGDR